MPLRKMGWGMVNEAFITEIQGGNREHLEELWNSVRPFVAQQAHRRVRACKFGGTYCGAEVDDLIQEGFFAFLRAVETYRGGSRMTFIGWLDLYLKTAFNDALGVRKVQDYRDPIRWAVSLSQPIGDEDDGTLEELIAEDHNVIDDLENEIWMQQLRRAVNESLAGLSPEYREILVRRYWQCQTFRQIAEADARSHQAISDKEKRAFKMIRKHDVGGKLAEFASQL